jgi:4-carboxymuconolactone decarboxylase
LPEGWTRWLAQLAAAAAIGDEPRLTVAMERLRDEGRALEVEEAVLQTYVFAGYPRALNAFTLWRRLSGAGAPASTPDDEAAFEARGAEVCRRVYGRVYGRLRRNIARLHPDLDRWMVTEGYGKILGRPGLDLRTRELCAVAALAALGVRPQLHAHLQGAINTGVPRPEIDRWVGWLEEMLPGERATLVRRLWEDVRVRRCL